MNQQIFLYECVFYNRKMMNVKYDRKNSMSFILAFVK